MSTIIQKRPTSIHSFCRSHRDFRFSLAYNQPCDKIVRAIFINFYKTVHLTGIYKEKFGRAVMLLVASHNAAINCHLGSGARATECVYMRIRFFFATQTWP